MSQAKGFKYGIFTVLALFIALFIKLIVLPITIIGVIGYFTIKLLNTFDN